MDLFGLKGNAYFFFHLDKSYCPCLGDKRRDALYSNMFERAIFIALRFLNLELQSLTCFMAWMGYIRYFIEYDYQ